MSAHNSENWPNAHIDQDVDDNHVISLLKDLRIQKPPVKTNTKYCLDEEA